jgi:hypothetical protein
VLNGCEREIRGQDGVKSVGGTTVGIGLPQEPLTVSSIPMFFS